MLGIGILFGFQVMGLVLMKGLSLPLPANVLGLLLLLIALFANLVKVEWIEQSSEWLLRHMPIYFAPIIIGLPVYMPFIKQEWLLIAVSVFGSTFISVMVSGLFSKLFRTKES